MPKNGGMAAPNTAKSAQNDKEQHDFIFCCK